MERSLPPEDDHDPFGVLEILRRRSDLVDRLGPLRRPARSGPHSDLPPGAAKSPPVTAAAVVTRLPFLESVFCLTRVTPAAHRVRVAYSLNGQPHAAVCSWLPGRPTASVNSCLGRGPCCAVHDVELPPSVTEGVSSEDRDGALSAAVEAVRRRSPHCAIAGAAYLGLYGEATITEALSRTPPGASAEGELRQALEAERDAAGLHAAGAGASGDRSAAQRELDLLDLDCMLSILGPGAGSRVGERAGGRRGGAPSGDGGDTLVTLASVTLFFGHDGRPLEWGGAAAAATCSAPAGEVLEGLARTLTTATASLRSVGLRHDAPWLPFRRDSPGSLLLVALCNRGALAAPIAAGIEAEALRLVAAATAARAQALAGPSGDTEAAAPAPHAAAGSPLLRPWEAPGWGLVLTSGPAAAAAAAPPLVPASSVPSPPSDPRELRELRWVQLAWRPRRARRGGAAAAGAAVAGGVSGGVDIVAVDIRAIGAAAASGAPFVDFSATCAALRLVYVLRCHLLLRRAGGSDTEGAPPTAPPEVAVELLILDDSAGEDASHAPPLPAPGTQLASIRADTRFSLQSCAAAAAAAAGRLLSSGRHWCCAAPSILPAPPAHPTAVVQGAVLRAGGARGAAEPPLQRLDIVVEATQAPHY